jgi:hypothetical protein
MAGAGRGSEAYTHASVAVEEDGTAFGTGQKGFLLCGKTNAIPEVCMVFAISCFQTTQRPFRRLITDGV